MRESLAENTRRQRRPGGSSASSRSNGSGAALLRRAMSEAVEALLQTGPAVDNDELGRLQSAGNQIVEHATPGGLALPAHVLDREQDLLPVLAHAKHHQQRDRGRLP